MRCFVALDLPPPVCIYLAGLAQLFQKKGNVKWVPADQLHVTLVFAGDVEEEAVEGLRKEEFRLVPIKAPTGEPGTVHLSISDASGDSAIRQCPPSCAPAKAETARALATTGRPQAIASRTLFWIPAPYTS